ncbi:MAG: PQQ-binding-like beta-propeller repeat protein [Flavobacteriaceae bacterium]
MNRIKVLFMLSLSCVLQVLAQEQSEKPVFWNQSSGPNASWKIISEIETPVEFSVRSGQNILWTMDLPEVGQGGITVWGDKIFLTVMKPVFDVPEREALKTNTILALCIDAKKRKILWKHEIEGSIKSPYFYGFSDSTTPAPVTDGNYVWFFNASGKIVCFDMDGKQVWERSWKPVEVLGNINYPFNKQFEPLLYNDLLINMEPYWSKDGTREFGWNYLFAIDKNTGETVWISEDGLTHYSTPFFNKTSNGTAALLMGRGAHHKVPESPKGYSLVNLETGKSLWRYETQEGMAMYNAIWTPEYALWFTERENKVHKVGTKTGKLIEKISLNQNISLRTYDTINQQYKLKENFSFQDPFFVFPAWYTNIIVNDKCYFMCFKKSDKYRLQNVKPDYSFGRIDLKTKKVEYLEIPVQYELVDGKKNYLWHVDLKTETNNIRELDVAFDKRSQRDGWVWNFNANPILVNEKLFFTTMSGLIYCIDTTREKFDEKSLLSVNDLGPKGKTWTLNTPSFSEGKMYHRTSKQLICIGTNESD